MRRIDQKLANLKAAQEAGKYTLCPRCGQDTMNPSLPRNALSRITDMMICSTCGMDEAKMAFMNAPNSLYSWAGLQPEKPASDFKTLPGKEVWERVYKEQKKALFDLYERFEAGEDPNEIRLCAFESCPGLLQIWTQPFQMNFAASDGTVVLRFRRVDGKLEIAADLIERGANG